VSPDPHGRISAAGRYGFDPLPSHGSIRRNNGRTTKNKTHNRMSHGKHNHREEADDEKVRQEIYDQQRAELVNKQNSNSEKYDSSILTLSSAGFGLSITLLKDVIPLNECLNPWLLITSWILFGSAILCTIISFQASQAAIRKNLDHAEKYYLEKKDEFQNKGNGWISVTDWLNVGSGTFFIAAIVCTAIFVSVNLLHQIHEPKIDTSKSASSGHALDPAVGHANQSGSPHS